MDVKFLSILCLFILLLLRFPLIAHGNGGMEMDSRNQDHKQSHHVHSHGSSSHLGHMNPLLDMFFLIEDLKMGNTLRVTFPRSDINPRRPLLSGEEADSIPFSLNQLPTVLKALSIPQNSPRADGVKNILAMCEPKPDKYETKYCATSLDSLLDLMEAVFGPATQIKILHTSHTATNSSTGTVLQKYVIKGLREIPRGTKVVACHTPSSYPYVVFFCHIQHTETRVFSVSLAGEDGDDVETVAVCHIHTSHWRRDHETFRKLGVEPGTTPVCHLFPEDDFVWVPAVGTGHNVG